MAEELETIFNGSESGLHIAVTIQMISVGQLTYFSNQPPSLTLQNL